MIRNRKLLFAALLLNLALLVPLALFLGAHMTGPHPDGGSGEGGGSSYGLTGPANAVGAALAVTALAAFIGIFTGSVLKSKRPRSARASRVLIAVSAWALANVWLAFVLGLILYHALFRRG